jgi:hypothetical protein
VAVAVVVMQMDQVVQVQQEVLVEVHHKEEILIQVVQQLQVKEAMVDPEVLSDQAVVAVQVQPEQMADQVMVVQVQHLQSRALQ